MATPTGSIAVVDVISRPASGKVIHMSDMQFQAEAEYQVSIAIAKTLRGRGLLTEHEYALIDSRLLDRYRPVLGGLFSQK